MEGHDDITKRERVDWFRTQQRRRLVYLECADGYVEIGRRMLRRRIRDVRGAVRVLTKAAAAYQGAGITRRGQVVWRYARLAHAISVREALR